MRLFDRNSPLLQYLSLLCDLMVLNVLTILCSLPIITIGAATSALYDSVWRLKQGQGTLFRNYFHAFRKNFVQATCLFLPLLLLGCILGYNALLLFIYTTPLEFGAYLPYVICVAVWSMIASWVFPLQTRFENKIGRTYLNSMICALRYLLRSMVMALINLAPWVIFILSPEMFVRLMMVWIFVWFGVAAFINMQLLDVPMTQLTKLAMNRNEDSKIIE